MLSGALWECGRGLTMSQWVAISAMLSVVHVERNTHISPLMQFGDAPFKYDISPRPVLPRKDHVKFILLNKDFLTWHLIDWQNGFAAS